MQCYTELTPPTAVTHSLSLPFVSANSQNLIVAKTSLLQIFNTKKVPRAGRERSTKDETKLILVAEYALAGTITALVRIKIQSTKSGGEALLVAFQDAKLSLVEWDPERAGISTISIHFYEQDDYQGSPWQPEIGDCVNYLTADPGSRCAAFEFGGKNLAILPFKQGDEDVNMEDEWDEEIDGPKPEKIVSKITNGDSNSDIPYGSSFVIRLARLNVNLINPGHLAFLYEYRQPTFGILCSTTIPSAAMLYERKDNLTYMVFTLDLHQRSNTPILSVSDLPYDLSKVIPLPLPIGGALLVGGNELIHVNQAGVTNGVGVNVYAKQCTSFKLLDQSDLDLRLEGCMIEQLSIANGEMLIITQDGAFAILSFEVDGRSVSGLSIRKVAAEAGGLILKGRPTSLSQLGTNAAFIGSETGDSVVVGWSRKHTQLNRRKSRILLEEGSEETLVGEDNEEDDDDDEMDDDLYGESTALHPANGAIKIEASNSKAGEYVFRIHDSMINVAPTKNLTLGKAAFATIDEEYNAASVTSELELVAAVGGQRAGALAVMNQSVQPKVIGKFDFPDAHGVWAMSAKKPTGKGPETNEPAKGTESGEYDRLMLVSKTAADGSEESDVYELTPTGFELLEGTEFEHTAGSTIEAGTLGRGMRIIQVLKSEVRSYDGDFGLSQIIPMYDDDTGAEPTIISASFADPFVLLIRNDSSIFVAQCDDNNELEEIEREDNALLDTKWLTGCLYTDATGIFAQIQSDKGQTAEENTILFLLSTGGALHIYALPDLSKAVYVAEGICFVPPNLSANYAARKSLARENLTEIMVADLGDFVSKSPYLILRQSNDDLTIYEPFRTDSTPTKSLVSTLLFVKIQNPHLAKDPKVSAQEESDEVIQDTRDTPMRALSNLGGYSAVFLSGASPSFIIKSSKSLPKVISLQGAGVRNMSSFHTAGCERGFVYTDVNGVARVCQLPTNTSFELGVALRKVELGQAVHGVAYHPPSKAYAVAVSTDAQFELPKGDDTIRKEWLKEVISFKPTIEQSFIKLINPVTWAIIDEFELEPCETILCIKTLDLMVSEITGERKKLITVGTALTEGEDLAARGQLYVFDIVPIVPPSDQLDKNKKLQLIAKEAIPRGAVTGVSEIGNQGFMLVSHGQKCMVRGLKEDGSLLPVAFLDVNIYVTALKVLPGSGICLMGDILKGVWVAGYTEEPYRMMLFGKSSGKMEVVAADFIPYGKHLFVIAVDANCNLHIMQYDPEHPKSLHGQLLLHRTTFSLGGHLPTTMTLLPRTLPATTLPATPAPADEAADATVPDKQLIITTTTGSIGLLSPLNESQYRKLNTLASTLSNTLYHACGLNPRAYRAGSKDEDMNIGGRNVVDGSMLLRFMELGSQRRSEVASRAGIDVEEVREDLAGLMGGLAYL